MLSYRHGKSFESMSTNDSRYVFLTVRTSSTRLSRKCFLPFGDSTVLGHVISRSLNFNFIPIVCTSDDPSDDEIEEYCNRLGINCFRGSLGNKLLRWHKCAEIHQVSAFHTVDVDDPFFDPTQVIESLSLLDQENLDVVYPTEISASGSASVGYSISSKYLANLLPTFEELKELEMVDIVFNNFAATRSKVLFSKVQDARNLRLTLDYAEDYWLLCFILRMVGPFCAREQIIELFAKNPDLYLINWFRNHEWADKQMKSRFQTQESIGE